MKRLLIALPLATLPAIVLAKDVPTGTPLAKLEACRGIAESAVRLACYDREVAALTAATAAKDVVVVDRREVREAKRGLFGFNIGRIPFFSGRDGKDDDPESSEIVTKITSVRSTGYGKFRFGVEDGAIWETTEASSAFMIKPGDSITLSKGTLGAYFAKGSKGRRVQAKRVN